MAKVWNGWLVKDVIEEVAKGRVRVRLQNGRVYVVATDRFWDEFRRVCA